MTAAAAVFVADRFVHLSLLLGVLYCGRSAPKHGS